MFRIFLALISLAGISGLLSAASPDPKTLVIPPSELSRSRGLVHRLGSEEYTEREEAEQALAKMGRLARPALLEGVNEDPSPEVRNRCAALLPKATSLEMRARLEVFLADVEGKYEHDLPGWNQFRSVVCDDWNLFGYRFSSDRSLEKAARSVFVELIATAANKSVVMATSSTQTELNAIVIGRRQELYNQRFGRAMVIGGVVAEPVTRREPTAEDVAALLFAESLAPQSQARIPRAVSISVLFTTSGFSSQVRDTDEKGRVYKAIASAWMESRINPLDLYQAMTLAPNMGLSQLSARLAARLFSAQGAPNAYRGNAAMTLARVGGREHIPLLEKAFEDNSVLSATRPNIRVNGNINEAEVREIQIRDVALAVSIQLAGEKPEDYGFIDQYKANTANPGTVVTYNYTRYYIPEDKRAAAFEKWKEWWAKNKKARD